jgi:hypothetical protein
MKTNWDDLIQRYLAEQTSAEETRQLETALKSDDDLVDLYLRYAELDVALGVTAESTEATRELLIAPAKNFYPYWFSWRPLTAAAAGIIFGILCTSVVFGYDGIRFVKAVQLNLVNAGFEMGEGPLKPGYSRQVAQWTGTALLATTAEGQRCARLTPMLPLKEKSRAGVLLQTLDLETMGAMQTPEGTRLVLSVEVNASGLPPAGMRQFALRVLTFSQSAQEVLEVIWPNHPKAAEANVVRTVEVDADAKTWQRLRTPLELPKGTRSVMIEISGPRTPLGTEVESLPEFCVDSVRAHLEIPREVLP